MTVKGFNRIADARLFPLLLFLAILLRLVMVDHAFFRNDSARDAIIAQKIAQGHTLVHGSATGWDGVFRGPIYYHYLSLFYRISPDPRVLTLSSILPNILALLVCFWFCRRWFGPTVARFATLMYAFSPMAIGLFNFMLEVNVSPLILSVSLLCLFLIVFDEKRWMVVPLGFCLGLLWDNSQYYLSTILMALILLAPKMRSIGVGRMAAALAALALAMTPYLLMDAAGRFTISSALVQGVFDPGAGDSGIRGVWNLGTYVQPLGLVLALLSFAADKRLFVFHPEAFFLSLAQAILFLIGLYRFCAISVRTLRKRATGHGPGHRNETLILHLTCWFWAPLPMLMIFSQSPQLRFYYNQYPVNFLMIAMGAVLLIGGRRSWMNPEEALERFPARKAVAWGALILLCLSQAGLTWGAAKGEALDNVRLRDRVAVARCILQHGSGPDLENRVWFNREQNDPAAVFYGYEYVLPWLNPRIDSPPDPSTHYAVIADAKNKDQNGPMLCRVNGLLAVYAFPDSPACLAWMKKQGYVPLSLAELMANNEQYLHGYFQEDR